jgi:hypothetical protein
MNKNKLWSVLANTVAAAWAVSLSGCVAVSGPSCIGEDQWKDQYLVDLQAVEVFCAGDLDNCASYDQLRPMRYRELWDRWDYLESWCRGFSDG